MAVGQRTINKSQFHAFKKSDLKREDAALSQGTVYRGSRFSEFESLHDDGRHLRVTGRELLGSVANNGPGAAYFQPGSRFGVYPISPQWLGGRATLYGEEFMQHKAHTLRIIYTSVVSATDTGSIAIFFNDDVGLPTVDVGMPELTHAATREEYMECNVWMNGSLEIKPESALSKYFDESSGDERLQIQGAIVVEAGTGMNLAFGETLGHVYLEYDLEFFTQALDYSVPMRSALTWTLTAAAGASAIAKGSALMGTCDGVAAAGYLQGAVLIDGVAITDERDLTGKIGCVTITSAPTLFSGTAWWCTATDPTPRSFQIGQTFYARWSVAMGGAPVGKVIGCLYADMASAGFGAPDTATNPNAAQGLVIMHTATVLNDSTALTCYGQLADLSV